MGPFEITGKILKSVSGLLNHIDLKTASMIRQSFFMFIFVLSAIGIYVGYSKGKEAAQVMSPPLAEYTKDLFEIDRNREKDEGKFGSMLESELLNEMKQRETEKIHYPSREELTPEKSDRILEPGNRGERKIIPGTHEDGGLAEGDYRGYGSSESQVKPLEKKMKTVDPEIIRSDTEERGAGKSGGNERGRGRINIPPPIKGDMDIIER